MGHIHLGVLPKSRKWRDVVGLLEGSAADDEVVAASARAAEKDLLHAAADPVFVEAVRLLSMVPTAARSESFGQALRDLDIPCREPPDLFGIVAALGQRLDYIAGARPRPNDFGELARRALLSTVTAHLGDRLPELFAATPTDVRAAARQLSAPREFSTYARGFFTRLLGETLRYWLDRAMASQIGAGQRFADAGQRSRFDKALAQYCMEATFIIKEFSAGWYGKTLHREGRITSQTAAAYGAVAFRKIREELSLKWSADV